MLLFIWPLVYGLEHTWIYFQSNFQWCIRWRWTAIKKSTCRRKVKPRQGGYWPPRSHGSVFANKHSPINNASDLSPILRRKSQLFYALMGQIFCCGVWGRGRWRVTCLDSVTVAHWTTTTVTHRGNAFNDHIQMQSIVEKLSWREARWMVDCAMPSGGWSNEF